MSLTFITPQSVEDLRKYRKELEFLQKFIPFAHWSQTDIDGFIEGSVGELTLVYFDKLLVGSFSFEMHKRSAEIHGVARPDLAHLLCPRTARQVLTTVYSLFFHRIFVECGKQVVLAKVPPECKGARGFVRMWGFKKINTEHGSTVWALRKETYLERVNGKEDSES